MRKAASAAFQRSDKLSQVLLLILVLALFLNFLFRL
jgi:hypothetical protein